MAKDFIAAGSRKLDELVAKATSQDESISDAFERMKTELHGALGWTVTPPSVNEVLYGRSSMPAAPPALIAEDPSVPQHCVRVVYPHLNDRIEIYGSTEEELDRKEAALRAMYGE
jgi:hypothetical protein